MPHSGPMSSIPWSYLLSVLLFLNCWVLPSESDGRDRVTLCTLTGLPGPCRGLGVWLYLSVPSSDCVQSTACSLQKGQGAAKVPQHLPAVEWTHGRKEH